MSTGPIDHIHNRVSLPEDAPAHVPSFAVLAENPETEAPRTRRQLTRLERPPVLSAPLYSLLGAMHVGWLTAPTTL